MSGSLPPLLVLTDRTQTRGRPLVDVVAAAAAGGRCGVVLREKDLPRDERASLAAALRPLVEVLLVASDGVDLASDADADADADGVHLAARVPVPHPRPPIVGRSCHDAAELRIAAADGVDYVTISPIHETASKPGYGPPLGLDGLRRAAASSAVPVYALGGIDATTAADCVAAGAAGVAVMGAVMRSPDPAATVAALLAALATAPREPVR